MNMMEFADAFSAFLSSRMGGLTLAVGALAAVGVLAYCGEKIWTAIANNEPVNLYQFVRPFLLALLCVQFHWVVATVNSLLLPINRATHEHFIVQRGGIASISEQNMRELTRNVSENTVEQTEQAISEEIAAGSRGRDRRRVRQILTVASMATATAHGAGPATGMLRAANAVAAVEGRENFITRGITRAIQWVIGWLFPLVAFAIQCMRIVFLSLLVLMGPIAMALSIFPGFTGNFKAWLIKYISVYLWLPILYFIDFVIFVMAEFAVRGTSGFGLDTSVITASGVMLITIQLIGIFAMMSIPTIASWMVQGGETGQGIRTPFAAAGAAAGTAAGVLTGKAIASSAVSKGVTRAAGATGLANAGGAGSSTPPSSESSS